MEFTSNRRGRSCVPTLSTLTSTLLHVIPSGKKVFLHGGTCPMRTATYVLLLRQRTATTNTTSTSYLIREKYPGSSLSRSNQVQQCRPLPGRLESAQQYSLSSQSGTARRGDNQITFVKERKTKLLNASLVLSRTAPFANSRLDVAATAEPQTALEQQTYLPSRARRERQAAAKRKRQLRMESEKRAR